MQVILKPVSHPDLGEIIVNDNLFAIGRHEEPFSSYDPTLVSKLSRRHARIFEQEDAVYIVDLGSLNGTSVNGTPVEKDPVQLHRGDEVCFADYLAYQVEILGSAANRPATDAPPAPVRLVLIPENHDAGIEPIVITQFPFLVSKTSDVFSRYRDTSPDEVRFLSRKQAHFFVRDKNLYVEDLGSTNGTFVSGVQLEEHAHILHSGDVVAFGGDHFSYRVRVEYPDSESATDAEEGTGTGPIEGIEDVTRTTFVSSANSFLDIFCIEEEDDEDEVRDTPQEQAGGKAADERPGFLRRSRTVLREMKGALSEDKGGASGRKIWIVAAGVILAGAVALGVFMFSAPEREVESLLEKQDYAAAVASANRHLARHPDDQDMERLATEALLRGTLPDWLALIGASDYSGAQELLESARQTATANPRGVQMLDILEWATRLEQFMSERGGPDAPTVMFAHEAPIEELLAWWEQDEKTKRRLLGSMSQQVPAFSEMRATLFSHVRTLSSQKSLDLAAIDKLLLKTRDVLDNGDPETLSTIFDEFEKTYPRIAGTEILREDLDHYLSLNRELKERNWIEARRIVDSTTFGTPPFSEKVARIETDVLPTDDIMVRYEEASAAWRAGDIKKSFTLLEALTEEQWWEVAVATLGDKRALASRFEALQAARGSDGYEEQLLQFYNDLDPVEDVFFAHSVESEFRTHREHALSRADEAFKQAENAWNEYLEKGGIRGLQRLEGRVSEQFREQAGRLGDAMTALGRSARVYRSLGAKYPEEWSGLYNRVLGEVSLQRRSLTELAMVLEPSLLKAKLELLPDTGDVQPNP